MPHPRPSCEGKQVISDAACHGIWPSLARILAEYEHLQIQCARLHANSTSNGGSGDSGVPLPDDGLRHDWKVESVSSGVGTFAERYNVKVVVQQVDEPQCEPNKNDLPPCACADSKHVCVSSSISPKQQGLQLKLEESMDGSELSSVPDWTSPKGQVRHSLQIATHMIAKESKGKKDDKIAKVVSGVISEQFHMGVFHDTAYKNKTVETCMVFVILLNAVTIGVSADVARNHPGWFYLELIFVTFFVLERAFKFSIIGGRMYFFGNDWMWNVFETLMMFLSITEVVMGLSTTDRPNNTDDVSVLILRVVRLVRIAKVIRILRLEMFTELVVMVQGIVGGVRTLFWAVVLISIPLYCVCLVMRETAGNLPQSPDTGTESFATVYESFFTMFRCVVGGDCSTKDGRPVFALLSAAHGRGYALLYSIVIMFMTFGMFNVIAAIYVENTIAAAKYNALIQKHNRLQDQAMFNSKVQELLQLLHSVVSRRRSDSKGRHIEACDMHELAETQITPDLFQELCKNARFSAILEDLDVSEEDRMGLFDTLDVDGGGTIDLHELISGIAKLRGDPRRADIIEVGLILRSVQAAFQDFEQDMRTNMIRLLNKGGHIAPDASAP